MLPFHVCDDRQSGGEVEEASVILVSLRNVGRERGEMQNDYCNVTVGAPGST